MSTVFAWTLILAILVVGLMVMRRTRRPPPPPPPGLLLEVESSPRLTGYPGRLRAFEDGVEVSSYERSRHYVRRVGYRQIAQVVTEDNGGIVSSYSVHLQTTGGGVLSLHGLNAEKTDRLTTLLNERTRGL